MKFLRENWFYFTSIAFVAFTFYMGFFGQGYSQIQTILIYSLMALLAHQFEEYVFPGGGGIALNKGQYFAKENFRRFPANMQSGVVINVTAWLFYILAIIFPQFIWLGLGIVFVGFAELIAHSVIWNRGLKTWYNPGLATSVFLLFPLAVYYIYVVHTNNLATTWDWIGGVITLIVMLVVVIIIPTLLFKNPNSPYSFSEWQVQQQEKIQKFASLKK